MDRTFSTAITTNIFANELFSKTIFRIKSFFIQLQDNEGKENGVETDERKDDSIVYADLDKSAMSEGRKPMPG